MRYALALEVAKRARDMAARVPRGHRTIADHLLRSAAATVLLIAEGANRVHDGDKRRRYAEARGECGESAAACELLAMLELVDSRETDAFLRQAARLGSLLTGLVNRFRRAQGEPEGG